MVFEREMGPASPSEVLNHNVNELQAKFDEVQELKRQYDSLPDSNPHKNEIGDLIAGLSNQLKEEAADIKSSI